MTGAPIVPLPLPASSPRPIKAIWSDTVLVESDGYVLREALREAFRETHVEPSGYRSTRPRKGGTPDLDVVVTRNEDAAWTYPEPKEAAADAGVRTGRAWPPPLRLRRRLARRRLTPLL